MSPQTAVILAGLHSLGFAVFHAGFWRMFRWPQSLQQTTLANRAIVQIANVQLIWLFAFVAGACLLFPRELVSTPLGRALLLAMSGFWLVRLVGQWIWLRFNHAGLHLLNVLFAIGAALFAWPLLARGA